jgi:hypothetical protein
MVDMLVLMKELVEEVLEEQHLVDLLTQQVMVE